MTRNFTYCDPNLQYCIHKMIRMERRVVRKGPTVECVNHKKECMVTPQHHRLNFSLNKLSPVANGLNSH